MLPFVKDLSLNYTCGEDLVISKEEDCSLLFNSSWSSIIVKDGLCNSLNEELVITNYECLTSLHFESKSLQNIQSLVIQDNPNLQFILFGYFSLENAENVTIASICYYFIIITDLPSLNELQFISNSFYNTFSMVIHGLCFQDCLISRYKYLIIFPVTTVYIIISHYF